MDAFFSIDRRQAFRSIYSRYDADAGFKDAGIGIRFDHEFTDRVALLAALRYARLIGDAADSPIVEGPGGSRPIHRAVRNHVFVALRGLTGRRLSARKIHSGPEGGRSPSGPVLLDYFRRWMTAPLHSLGKK